MGTGSPALTRTLSGLAGPEMCFSPFLTAVLLRPGPGDHEKALVCVSSPKIKGTVDVIAWEQCGG